jgi:hypothetical protein
VQHVTYCRLLACHAAHALGVNTRPMGGDPTAGTMRWWSLPASTCHPASAPLHGSARSGLRRRRRRWLRRSRMTLHSSRTCSVCRQAALGIPHVPVQSCLASQPAGRAVDAMYALVCVTAKHAPADARWRRTTAVKLHILHIAVEPEGMGAAAGPGPRGAAGGVARGAGPREHSRGLSGEGATPLPESPAPPPSAP